MEEELTFPDLPIEMIEQIMNSGVPIQGVIRLGMVSRSMHEISDLINYFRTVDYKMIKDMRNVPRFKNIKITDDPGENISGILEKIKPKYLYINFTWTKSEKNQEIIIPKSVVKLYAKGVTINLDTARNSALTYLKMFRFRLSGSIPGSVKYLSLDNILSYNFENPDNVTKLSAVLVPNQLSIRSVLAKMSNLVSLHLFVYGFPAYAVIRIPRLLIKKLDMYFSDKKDPIIIDLKNMDNLQVLRIETFCKIEIRNPPTNLEKYHIILGTQAMYIWNGTLNISAKSVTICSPEDIDYVCDKRVEKLVKNKTTIVS